MQPLRYILSVNSQKNALIFSCLRWAAYLKDWKPAEGEKPPAYLVILGNKEISPLEYIQYDCGIAAQTILLGAREKDLGGCLIHSIDREKLRNFLEIPEKYEILLVLAIGKPKEKVIIEPVRPDGDIKYWRDGKDVHHLPKRALDELIIKTYGEGGKNEKTV